MITASAYGAPNWVDLATPDVEAATTFYARLFDWEIEKSKTPMGDYYIGRVPNREVAGMMQQAPEIGEVAMWTTFFYVEDIDAVVHRVGAAGGRILQAPFIIPDGKVAVVSDPAGAMFGLITHQPAQGVWLSRDPGSVSWVETLSRDPAASEGFYTAVFDWKAETQDHAETRYTTFSLDEGPVAGMMMMPDSVPAEVPSHWAIYFTVEDIEMTVRKAIEMGGGPIGPIMDMEMGRFAVVEDPQEAVFQLMEYSD